MYKIETPTEAFSKPAISFQQNLKLTRLFAQNPKLVLDHFQLYQGMKILDVWVRLRHCNKNNSRTGIGWRILWSRHLAKN